MYGEFYFCTKCDRVYEGEEVEVLTEREYRGECHGVPAYEEMDRICCPHCGSTVLDEVTIDDEMAERIIEISKERDIYRFISHYWNKKYHDLLAKLRKNIPVKELDDELIRNR